MGSEAPQIPNLRRLTRRLPDSLPDSLPDHLKDTSCVLVMPAGSLPVNASLLSPNSSQPIYITQIQLIKPPRQSSFLTESTLLLILSLLRITSGHTDNTVIHDRLSRQTNTENLVLYITHVKEPTQRPYTNAAVSPSSSFCSPFPFF